MKVLVREIGFLSCVFVLMISFSEITSLGQEELTYMDWIRDIDEPLPIRVIALKPEIEKTSISVIEELFSQVVSAYPNLLQSNRRLVTSFAIYNNNQPILLNLDGTFGFHNCAFVVSRDPIYMINLHLWAEKNDVEVKLTKYKDSQVIFLCADDFLNIPYFQISTDYFLSEVEEVDIPTMAAENAYIQVRSNISKKDLEGILRAVWLDLKEKTGFRYLPRVSHVNVYAGISEEAIELGSFIGELKWNRSQDGDSPRVSLSGWDGYKKIQKRILRSQSGIVTSRLNIVVSGISNMLQQKGFLPLEIHPITESFKNQMVGISVTFEDDTDTGGDSIQITWEYEGDELNRDLSSLFEASLQLVGKNFFEDNQLKEYKQNVIDACSHAQASMESIGINTKSGTDEWQLVTNELRVVSNCTISQTDSEFYIMHSLEISTEQLPQDETHLPVASIKEISFDVYVGEEILLDASNSHVRDGEIVSYEWFLPNDRLTESDEPLLKYSFDIEGNWLVMVKILDNHGNEARTEIRVLVQCNVSPEFHYPNGIKTQQEVVFRVDNTICRKNVASIEWDLDGDNVVDAKGSEVSTVYEQAGDYLVTQIVVLDNGDITKHVDRINVELSFDESRRVPNLSPEARIELRTTEIFIGDRVTFDGHNSKDQDGSIANYIWLFSDGTRIETANPITEQVFWEEGEWTATLQVVDNNGGVSNSRIEFYVDCNLNPPFHTPGEVKVEAEVKFETDVTICRTSITSVGWDFNNDGIEDASGNSVTTSFDTPGDYLITQIIDTGDGERIKHIERIRVTFPNVESSYLSASIGLIDEIPMYKFSIGLPINDWLILGANYGIAQGKKINFGYEMDSKIQTAGIDAVFGITKSIRMGLGVGALLVHQNYQIDVPTTGPTESTRFLPHVSLLVGFQWGFFLVAVEVYYVPDLF